MGLSATPAQILGSLTGRDTITQTALTQWQRNFNAFSAVRRASFYTELIARLSNMPQAWTPFPRLIERFAEVRQGDGSQVYLLTEVNPTPGELYSPEYNSEDAARFLFGNHAPDLRQSAIAQVRNWTKALTIKDHEIAAADFGGMLNIASRITDSLQDSDYLAEWKLGMGMFFDAVRSGIAAELTTPAPTNEETAREFSAFVGSVADFLNNPSDKYNPGRITKMYPVEDLIVVLRTTTWQTLNKSQYSKAFQPEYMRGIADSQYVTIPDENWPSDLSDVTAVVISKGTTSTVLVVDNATDQAASVNAPWTSVNQTRTKRSVLGINQGGAMVVIKNGTQVAVAASTPVPTDIELEIQLNGAPVTELIRGYQYKLVAKVTDEHGFTAGRADIKVTGAESPTSHTFVQVDDLDFYVGLDEEATELTLVASSALDSTVQVSVSLDVVGTLVPLTPPFEPIQWDEDEDGLFNIELTPSQIATFSGHVATPPATVPANVTLTRAGTVGGVALASAPFTAPVTLTTAGDTVTVTAHAASGYELTGATQRTLNY